MLFFSYIEAFQDGRFIAVLTHFDENYSSMDEEPVNACEVQERVSSCITDATETEGEPPVLFDQGSVIPISGQWAFMAALLESRDRDDQEYKDIFKKATRALHDYPYLNVQQGQGERLEDYFANNPDKAPILLYDASGVHELRRK